jgi:N-acetylglucosamine transport system permease protein
MYHQKYRLIIPFLAPAILLYAVFVLWPYAQAIYISLTQWSGVAATPTFIGLENYQRLINEPHFRNALGHNFQLLIVIPIVALGLALCFATLFTQGGQGVKGAQFYRVVFFFPQVMSVVIIGVLWQYIFNPIVGLLNGTLRLVGLEGLARPWLGDAATSLWAVAAVVIWQIVGFYMVLFIAGMQSIPVTFYEAATLDGASKWQAFWGITVPLLWDNIRIALIYVGITTLDLFTIVQVMTEGKPNRASDVVARYMYEVAFTNSQFGRASTIGVVLLLLTLALSVFTLRFTQRERLEF